MSLEQELLTLDEGLWTGGPQAYLDHCDAQCLVVFGQMARTMSKEDIAATAEGGRWTHVMITPRGFVQLSDTSAAVAYACSATRRDGQPHRAHVGSVYVKRADGWKLAFHQQTEVEA